jgi:hypothetical protein
MSWESCWETIIQIADIILDSSSSPSPHSGSECLASGSISPSVTNSLSQLLPSNLLQLIVDLVVVQRVLHYLLLLQKLRHLLFLDLEKVALKTSPRVTFDLFICMGGAARLKFTGSLKLLSLVFISRFSIWCPFEWLRLFSSGLTT